MGSVNKAGLKILLANTYTLYLKTQNYHWNVTGSHFIVWHEFFEKQYQALEEAIDDIAERIRALGEQAPGSFVEFIALKTIEEATPEHHNIADMLQQLVKDHTDIYRAITLLLEQARTEEDEVTQDLLVKRLVHHAKALWMIRSHLEG